MSGIIDRNPALFPAVGVAAGILLHSCGIGVWLPCVLAGAGLYILALRRRGFGMGLVAVALGWLSALLNVPGAPPSGLVDSGVHTYSATVCREDVRAGGRVDLIIDSVAAQDWFIPVAPFRVTALIDAPDYDLYGGQRVTCAGELRPLRPIADLPYAIVPHDFARRRGCAAELILEGASVEVSGTESWNTRCRLAVERLLVKAGADDRSLALFSAILAGDESLLSADSRERFRAAGVAHALALSGFHVGFVALLASVLLFPLRLWQRAWRLRSFGMILLVWAFAAFTGFGSSTVRACVMITALLLVRVSGRAASVWNSLFLAVALILCAAPAEIHSPGFLLSVSAVAGILAFSAPMNPVDPRRRAAYTAVQFVTVPVAAMLGTMVVVAAYFHALPVYFIASNLLISLLFPLIMSLGVLLLCAGALGVTGGCIAAAANHLCGFLDGAVAEIASWPLSQTSPLFLTGWGIVAVGAVLSAGALALNIPGRRVVVTCAVVMAGAMATAFVYSPAVPESEIFVVPYAGDTSVLLRRGDSCMAVLTSRPRHRAASLRRLGRTARLYLDSRNCDTLVTAPDTFSFGPFRRRGQFIHTGSALMAVPADGRRVDSISAPVRYLLLTNRCTATPDIVLGRLCPDTMIVSTDVSPHRRESFVREAAGRGIGVVDLRYTTAADFLR